MSINRQCSSNTNSGTFGSSGSSSNRESMNIMPEHASMDSLHKQGQPQLTVADGSAPVHNMLGCEPATTAVVEASQQAYCSMLRTLSAGQGFGQVPATPYTTSAALHAPPYGGNPVSNSTLELPLCVQPLHGHGLECASAVLSAILEAALKEVEAQQTHPCLPSLEVVQDSEVGCDGLGIVAKWACGMPSSGVAPDNFRT